MFEGMNQMLANVLKEAIPKEVVEMLAPEKVKEFGDKVNAFVVDVRERLDRIETHVNLTLNNTSDLRAELEALKNDNSNSGSKSTRVRKRAGGGTGTGTVISDGGSDSAAGNE